MKSDLTNKGYTVNELVAPLEGAMVYFVAPDSMAIRSRWYRHFKTAVRQGKRMGCYFRAAISSTGEIVV